MYQHLKDIEKTILKEFSLPVHKSLKLIAFENGYQDSSGIIRYIKNLEELGLIAKIKGGKYIIKKSAKKLDSKSEIPTQQYYNSYNGYNSTNAAFNNDLINIPFFGFAQCGSGGELLLENPESTISLTASLVKSAQSELFAVQAKGDSMLPQIEEKDTIICKKYANEPIIRNKFYVVTNAFEVMIKKIEPVKNGYILVSTNPLFSNIDVDPDNFAIAGQVVGVYKNLA